MEMENEWRTFQAESLLTGRAAIRREVKLKDLDWKTRKLFNEAIAKEWTSRTEFGAVEILDEDEAKAWTSQRHKVIGTRLVFTDKTTLSALKILTYPCLPKEDWLSKAARRRQPRFGRTHRQRAYWFSI